MPNLSLDWTLAKATGLMRITADAIAPDKFDPDTLIDILHTKVLQVAEMLGEAGIEEYIKTAGPLTITTNKIDISAYRIDRIIAMRSATAGVECKEKGTKEFEAERYRAQITGGVSTVIWTRQGTNVEFFNGSGTTPGTMTMIYKAIPTKATTGTDTLDIPDKYAPLAIDLAEAKLYELMNQAPPESLSDRIAARTNQIRQVGMSENQKLKKPN